MFNNWYEAEYAHKEYERRIQTHLAERALLKTMKERNKTSANPIGLYFRLGMNLVTTTWRWGQNMVQRMGWTLHVIDKRPIQHN